MNDFNQDEKKSNRMKYKKTRYITCCDISIVIVLIHFCHLVYFVRIRLTSLNRALQKEAKSAEQLKLKHVEDIKFVPSVVANDVVPKNARFRGNFLGSTGKLFKKINTADKIKSYSQAYEKLWEAVDHLNEYVGFGIISWKTINFVCEILSFTKDDDTRSALSVFAMQLSYCKIRFHMCGLVIIERSLITAVSFFIFNRSKF
ncbi:unnamed protein product [Brassicogethes aeneus]|uniref:Uncharacterized protein n=1 Tax=Brassicogethes aeneus TaxID=1431903 RepID=A0A9P0FM55_BRAAE|nr:unnamed protein product [Brassicogethes aeneus]